MRIESILPSILASSSSSPPENRSPHLWPSSGVRIPFGGISSTKHNLFKVNKAALSKRRSITVVIAQTVTTSDHLFPEANFSSRTWLICFWLITLCGLFSCGQFWSDLFFISISIFFDTKAFTWVMTLPAALFNNESPRSLFSRLDMWPSADTALSIVPSATTLSFWTSRK